MNEPIRVQEVTIILEQANKKNKELKNLTEIQKAKLQEKAFKQIAKAKLKYQVDKEADSRKLAKIKTDHLQGL